MSRITKKKPELNMYVFDRDIEYATFDDGMALLQIVGKLEDLEEEIGCPLDVLFRALTNGIYQEDGGRRKYPLIEYNSATKKFFFGFGTYCNVEDYKKTWWLREDKSE